jgi:hypothetical protein
VLDSRVEDPRTPIQHPGVRTPDMAPTRDHLIEKGVSRHVYVRLSPRYAAMPTAFANVLSGRFQEPL